MNTATENKKPGEVNFINSNCVFTFDLAKKEITGDDLKDCFNGLTCYNKTSKSFKKALEAVSNNFNTNLSMYDVMNIIENAGVKMRSYCSVD